MGGRGGFWKSQHPGGRGALGADEFRPFALAKQAAATNAIVERTAAAVRAAKPAS